MTHTGIHVVPTRTHVCHGVHSHIHTHTHTYACMRGGGGGSVETSPKNTNKQKLQRKQSSYMTSRKSRSAKKERGGRVLEVCIWRRKPANRISMYAYVQRLYREYGLQPWQRQWRRPWRRAVKCVGTQHSVALVAGFNTALRAAHGRCGLIIPTGSCSTQDSTRDNVINNKIPETT